MDRHGLRVRYTVWIERTRGGPDGWSERQIHPLFGDPPIRLGPPRPTLIRRSPFGESAMRASVDEVVPTVDGRGATGHAAPRVGCRT